MPARSRAIAESLIARFTALATLSAMLVVAFAFVSFQGLSDLQNSTDQLQRIARIVQRDTHADLMREAIKGDILSLQVAAAGQDGAGAESARADFSKHSSAFTLDMDVNLAQNMPASVKANMRAVMAAVRMYIDAGQAALNAVRGPTSHLPAIAVFREKHSFLATANDALSKGIRDWAAEAKRQSAESSDNTRLWIAVFALLALLCSIMTPVYATASIFAPLRRLHRIMQDIAQGDSDVAVPLIGKRNEMGEVARSVDVFRASLSRIREMTAQQGIQQEAAQREKREMLAGLARQFEARVQSIIDNVGLVAAEMLETAQSMNGITNATYDRASSAASESRQASGAARSIATSVEQMSEAAQEIAVQISQSTALVKKTVGEVSKAETASAQLRSANAEIGTIVQVIQEITGQINLLALNATIESARAGEAGRGFAVVAAEVKNLASQTSKATEQISEQISRVQHVSQDVVAAFSTIKTSIEKVDHFAAMVAAAAEQQTATTNAISSSMTASVRGASRVTDDIGKVIEASDQANASASRVLESARLLSGQSVNLREEVARFLDEIKAA